MVKLYADSIEKNARTLDQVPTKWREDVKKELERRGWTEAAE